ncbi:helix-turn-helix protein [Amycolatopsis sulphurea]|uniref:Helix-turn-helix protein n=1 Tax=Amycolatopsis sulphurea TaxID=76022 RepID=A0A2A9F7Z1_9PSEU|nr:helix-turn-helix transcriptional regulator [Amycolatopsis sulphurea]PFG46936.1 helix-turn-helix protein [Amycolatopsis sulphurea]
MNKEAEESSNELGSALREARLAARWGVRELARRLDMHPAFISSWELGHRTPKALDVACIIGALGVIGEEKTRILRLALAAELHRSCFWTARAYPVVRREVGEHGARNHAGG